MEFSFVLLFAAFAGGLFGAAIGGLTAFIFTGFMVLVGVAVGLVGGDFDFLTNVAFGPVFGPHISFAGGAAAAAFAARRGDIESGRDIGTPLTSVGDPLVLIVGGLFGMGGYVVQVLLASVLVVGGEGPDRTGAVALTDTIALTVAISAVVARLLFGKSGLLGSLEPDAAERGRLKPGGAQVWVAHQQEMWQASALGLGGGLLAAWVVWSVSQVNQDLVPSVVTLMFGVSAASLILLQFGLDGPVTHHMTLPGGVAAAAVVAAGGPAGLALAAGAVAGILGALLGELYSRLFLIHGDTHVDPPAFAIFSMATVVVLVQLVFGVV